ncbi:diguanylate cyclase domain-containing protein [Methyloversatilis sp.]|uniref:GGDEF domain-containing response regulator n=1 Tax=Methyloversatilis sp. TaxID=2569862 RepID=UPI0027326AED|nr:diguanylate cyclase [Methyloversatilis sp.]MDP2867364.1 diguanylate cyclase [Methyloversatilis sp.]MDP3454428.1 diguanylate cyclase [Methyloversatilis sp.]MDP3577578.1 diguanylate cyclase [Methyloversatilis sp.]
MSDRNTNADVTLPVKVLIVDDSRMVRASIIKRIRDRFDFREEADGEAGWQTLLVDDSIQVVLSDLTMPKLDGYGLLERVRSSRVQRIADIPVIMISGDEDDAARERARELGATDFITKGIGTVELIARIESASRLNTTRRQLADSREALAAASPIDPDSGMASPQYMEIHGAQLMSAAVRQRGEVSVLIVGIDNFGDIVSSFGRHVTDLIMRKLAKVLATKVRREDTFSQIGEGQFAIITPDISLASAEQFANRMRTVIAATAMQYRGQTLRISLNIGVANSLSDNADSVSQMLGLAVARADIAQREGGNTVRSSGGEPQKFAWTAGIVSIERALLLIKSGASDEIDAQLPALIYRLLPLLELISVKYDCDIPLDCLRQHASEADTSIVDKK